MVPWESSRSDSQLYRPKTGQDLLMQLPRCNWRAAQVRYGLERNSEPPEKFGAEAEPCLLYVDTAQGTELELLYFGCCTISALASSLNQLKSPFPRCATGGDDHDLAMTSKDSGWEWLQQESDWSVLRKSLQHLLEGFLYGQEELASVILEMAS